MINTKSANKATAQIIENITRWHHDRNLIEGTTDWNQTKKLLEEFIEVVAAQMPEQSPEDIADRVHDMVGNLHASGRIKTVAVDDASYALKDAIGDMGVVAINMAERNQWSYGTDCLHGAYQEIQHRTGRMVDGMFVKQEDLTD